MQYIYLAKDKEVIIVFEIENVVEWDYKFQSIQLISNNNTKNDPRDKKHEIGQSNTLINRLDDWIVSILNPMDEETNARIKLTWKYSDNRIIDTWIPEEADENGIISLPPDRAMKLGNSCRYKNQ